MKKTLVIFLISLISTHLYSQIPVEDAKVLIESYISPLGNSLGAGLNNGWYNTAKPHKLGGVDITITTNMILINEEVKSFNIDDIQEGNMFSGGQTPSILGSGSGQSFSFNGNTYTMPKGLNIPIIPLPILQAGVGLFKGTELDIRYIPKIPLGKTGDVGLVGIGVKHNLLQWLPIIEKIPVDLSIQAGHSKISSEIELIDASGVIHSSLANLDISATTINLLLSKKVLMLTPYIGIGYNYTTTTFNVDDKYKIAEDNGEWLYIPVDALEEFVFQNNNDFRTNIGFRFNIAILALQLDYTISNYPVATIGAGLSLR